MSRNKQESDSDVAPVNMAPRPKRPSQVEVDEHMFSHLPYWSWCAHCVKGKAKSKKLRRASHVSDRDIPLVAIDYMLMEDSQSTGEESGMPILVVKDTLSPETPSQFSPVSFSSSLS